MWSVSCFFQPLVVEMLAYESFQRRMDIPRDSVLADDLRESLKFYFNNPVVKFRIRKQFPLKLTTQLVKIVLLTMQLSWFGLMRKTHVSFVDESLISLRHLLIPAWPSSDDIRTYPKTTGPLAFYTYDQFYDQLAVTLNAAIALDPTAVGTFAYRDTNHSLDIVVEDYVQLDMSTFADYYTVNTSRRSRKGPVPFDVPFTRATVKQFLSSTNLTINFDALLNVQVLLRLKATQLMDTLTEKTPVCVYFDVAVVLSNEKQTGQVPINLIDHRVKLVKCDTSMQGDVEANLFASFDVIDVLVMLVCALSCTLCVRALYRSFKLYRRTVELFGVLGKKLTYEDKQRFVNYWWILVIIVDVFVIIGSLLKVYLQSSMYNTTIYDVAVIILGLGTALSWYSLMRYLAFFKYYNVLILTMENTAPKVLRFLCCAAILFGGFLFCGWAILGPYHYKFRTISASAECLFAMMNGDDIQMTFGMTQNDNPVIYWYSKVFLFLINMLFIYVILSLFMAIIIEGYRMVVDQYQPEPYGQSDLDLFMKEKHVAPKGRVWTDGCAAGFGHLSACCCRRGGYAEI